MKRISPFFLVQNRFEKYADWIIVTARDTGIDPYILAALCWQETHFQPDKECFEPGYKKKYIDKLPDSKIRKRCPGVIDIKKERNGLSTSWGMAQIMGQTARERGFQNLDFSLLKSHIGLLYAAKDLLRLLEKYQNLEMAISAYNAGTPTERNRLDYVEPVLLRLKILQNEPLVQEWFKEVTL